ncbi:unnamed protein product [Bursaphelenchus xylophilus]|uniref:(pine wood nematode) hypothetical protein n=1 Tax=Bursaphelenchus xylophilus TaxID=6326 RepID=A0A7I8WMB6_BURXY|nr:unnamed protein product [Bursaphelenchus xylophilus]CAG9104332.1 unnamed protein product [Bursaphelenchus xylophilus]
MDGLAILPALDWSFSLTGSLYCAVIALYIANKGDFYVPALTWLGDNSLSIYLVFWPLLRYSEYAMQSDSYHVQTFLDKALLFFAAIQAGSLLEALSSTLAKWIKSKRRLLIVATLFLSAIAGLQSAIYTILPQEEPKFDGARLDHTNPLFIEYAASLYNRRAQPLNMTNLELKYLHNQMEIYVETALENCRGHNGQMPLVERMDYFCSEKVGIFVCTNCQVLK